MTVFYEILHLLICKYYFRCNYISYKVF